MHKHADLKKNQNDQSRQINEHKENESKKPQNEINDILILDDPISVQRPRSGDDGVKSSEQLIPESSSDSFSNSNRRFNKDILGMIDEELEHHTELLYEE